MPPLTRGPLPARVYWVRRAMVLGTALMLVFGIARLLAGGSDATDGNRAATLAADSGPTQAASSIPPTITAPTAVTTRGPDVVATPTQTRAAAPAAPEGTCADDDIAVTPEVPAAVAGRDVKVLLRLRTLKSPACTWRVSRQNLTVKITSGQDDIWSSLDCPRAIPAGEVVVRNTATTTVPLVWKGARRSDATCSRFAGWAMPGWYHVTASSIGGEPSDVQFELVRPTATTVTRTAQPTQSPGGTASPSQPRQSGRPIAPAPSKSPGASPSARPSGSASGSGR